MEGDFIRQRHSLKMSQDFNPRPPWGGRRDLSQRNKVAFLISIHALRGEGDTYSARPTERTAKFQSTPSVGRATARRALRGNRDKNFNPRPPWGGRQKNSGLSRQAGFHFNPRPPWGGRPLRQLGKLCRLRISIHALRGEGDFATVALPLTTRHFNPRPPWGGRLFRGLLARTRIKVFQSTPSVGRATKVAR